MIRLILLACYLFAICGAASASVNEGDAAERAGDYSRAIGLYKKEAERGDAEGAFRYSKLLLKGAPGVKQNIPESLIWLKKASGAGHTEAMAFLGGVYFFGAGVERNLTEAKRLGRLSAAQGSVQGKLVFGLSYLMSDLNYSDTNGKPDIAKYQKLANRTMSERGDEILARDYLYQAARSGLSTAADLLMLQLQATVGEGNVKRAIEWSALMPITDKSRGLLPIFKKYDELGAVYTSPQVIGDATQGALLTLFSNLKASGKVECSESDMITGMRFTAMKVVSEPSNAEYLPSNIPEVGRWYMAKGEWDEMWTFDVCHMRVDVPVHFVADGLAGARYVTGRDIKFEKAKVN